MVRRNGQNHLTVEHSHLNFVIVILKRLIKGTRMKIA